MRQPSLSRGAAQQSYRGRFAPSPTGPLHYGSLLAAVISYLDAKANQGAWLVRIEDIDPPRADPLAERRILHCLSAHALIPDEKISYQSDHSARYESTLSALSASGHTYRCPCSRKYLLEQSSHSQQCIKQNVADLKCAIKFRAPLGEWSWEDGICGATSKRVEQDFILKRKDGLYAYQLAVVTDDLDQGITNIVRGADLIDSTPMQLALYSALNQSPPDFAHLPTMNNEAGQKLSKQNLAPAVNNETPLRNLRRIIQPLLTIDVPPHITACSDMLSFACEHWDLRMLRQTPQFKEIKG